MKHSNEYMRNYMKRRHDDRMAYCRAKLGNVCLGCGSIDNLDIHHVNPATKRFTISTGVDRVTLEELDRELKKCVLLCKNCHHKKHAGKHGTLSVRGCTCALCVEAKRKYNKEYNYLRRLNRTKSHAS